MALDNFLWNETAQYYNAYSTVGFDYEKFVNETHLEVCSVSDAGTDTKTDAQDEENPEGQMCLEGDPANPGAIMADSFYSQVGNTKIFFLNCLMNMQYCYSSEVIKGWYIPMQ